MKKGILPTIITMCVLLTSNQLYALASPDESRENVFSYKVGDYEIILLSEGQRDNNPDILIGATPEMIRQTMPDGTFRNAVNAFLVKTKDKNYLIDTGFGRNLWDNLQSVHLSPEQIDVVILTHMHGDHTGGLLKDDKIAFPHARLILSKKEYIHSENEAKQASAILKRYSDKVETITPEEIGKKKEDGIYYIEAYGHTPGHIVCLIQSNNEQLLIWADVAHAMAIQMPYPDVSVVYDTDPDMAKETRKRLLEYASKNKITVAGMHIPYPSIGTVEASAAGYIFSNINL